MPMLSRLLLTWLLAGPAFGMGNQLTGHPSPYLAMHGADPVAWQEWGREAVELARREGRLIFVSSGYFSCHWCHVMQRKSYRDPEIAALLNDGFIPVKLDRELHPAVDAYLIAFAERQRGQGGWPLNVFLTPDGHPFHAVLYLPPDEFRGVVARTASLWRERGEEITDIARRAAREVSQARQRRADAAAPDPDAEGGAGADRLAAKLQQQALESADALAGGFGHQAKFPMAPRLGALLALQQRSADEDLGAFLRLTLTQMSTLGLADLAHGGFFRYTVDPAWQTPHFEKMLYTQAQLALLYLQAADVLGEGAYAEVTRQTLDFMLAEMALGDGLFAASLSAVDAEGVEGGHYLWRGEELAALLSPSQRALAALIWGLQGPADSEAGTLPRQRLRVEQAAERFMLEPAAARAQLAEAKRRMAAARSARRLPRDDKAITGWNGLALSALALAAVKLDEPRYREAAADLASALLPAWREGQLARAKAAGAWRDAASLADYAYLAQGLSDYAAAFADATALERSRLLARRAWELFRRDGLWHDSAEPPLPDMPGHLVLADVPLPAPDAMVLRLLLNDPDDDWRRQAESALAAVGDVVRREPLPAASMARLLLDAASEKPMATAHPE
jgi:uncharacterized protein YyaL (SSP411 family)